MASLTSRGRTLVSAGVTAAVAGLLLGQVALTGVGVLLLALVLFARVTVARSRGATTVREVAPRRVPAGQAARVDLHLTGAASAGALLVEDRLPWSLGTRPRFVLPGGRRAWTATLDYTVRSDVRGRFCLGPVEIRAVDPFGLACRSEVLRETSDLIVTPRVVPLPPTGRAGVWTGAGDNRPRAFASGSAEDVTVRDYRPGDPLRRVHWRTSARTGELMVRREEQPWQSRATVLVDNRASAHRGQGADSSLETAISLAASIAAHLSSRGFVVRLATADGPPTGEAWHDRTTPIDSDRLLEELAVLEPTRRLTLATDWLNDHARHGLLVAVLGDVTGDDAALHRLLLHARPACALVLDVARWGGAVSGTDTAAALRTSGWRAANVTPGAPFGPVWQSLGGGQ